MNSEFSENSVIQKENMYFIFSLVANLDNINNMYHTYK